MDGYQEVDWPHFVTAEKRYSNEEKCTLLTILAYIPRLHEMNWKTAADLDKIISMREYAKKTLL